MESASYESYAGRSRQPAPADLTGVFTGPAMLTTMRIANTASRPILLLAATLLALGACKAVEKAMDDAKSHEIEDKKRKIRRRFPRLHALRRVFQDLRHLRRLSSRYEK